MDLSPQTYALFQSKSRWSNPITLKMKGWGWLALFLGVLLGTAWARRSQDLHCGGKDTKRSGRKEGGEDRALGGHEIQSLGKNEWKLGDSFLPFPLPHLLSPAPACRALVDELEWEIAQVDPKKTIQMGSFRINPDGSQSVVEVTYCFPK